MTVASLAAAVSSKKWWIGGVSLALVAGIAIGVGVGVGLGPQSSAKAQASLQGAAVRSVPHRSLAMRAAKSRPSVVLVGDGLTESGFSFRLGGWCSQLISTYQRKADLINRGFGGYFTNWFKDYMLDSLYDVHQPFFSILFLGVKDSQIKASAGGAFTPPAQFGKNVDAIIGAGKKAGVEHFLIITPPPVWESPNGKGGGARNMSNTRLYVNELLALGSKHNATVLNIFDAWSRVPEWDKKFLQPDRLHLSVEGNAKLFADVVNTIKSSMPEVDPANLPWQFPSMDVIDREDPGPAFASLEA